MKICIDCGQSFSASTWQCSHCGFAPPFEDGYHVLALDGTDTDRNYDEQFHHELAGLEASCFWFRNRNRLIQNAIHRFFPKAESLFEIGCGTGFVLAFLAEHMPSLKLTAGELYRSGLSFVAQRVDSAELLQVDACALPFQEEFDVVGAFDVIEHIDDDQRVLEQIRNSLKPGGGVVLTVPQHGWLWSEQDVASCHRRRYSQKGLLQQVKDAGLEPVWATSFVSFLLPAMLLRRLRYRLRFRSKRPHNPVDEVRIGRITDRILDGVCTMETQWIGACRRSLPAGGSLLVVAKRP